MECGYFTIPLYLTQPLTPNDASHTVILFIIMGKHVNVVSDGFIQEVNIIMGENRKLREDLAAAQTKVTRLHEKNEQNKMVVIMNHGKRIFVSAGVLMIISYICLFACVFNVIIDHCKLRDDLADVHANATRLQEITGLSERENDVNEIISTTDQLDLEKKNIFHNFVASSQYYKMRSQENGRERTSESGILRNFFLTLNSTR